MSAKTIRVRIAVAVTRLGGWSAVGDEGDNDARMSIRVRDKFLAGTELVVHFVEADIPLPEPPAVVAGVVKS